jgi:hypothetical protein
MRYQLVGNQLRLKNRIKGYLMFCGKPLPENYKIRSWIGGFIQYLDGIEFQEEIGRECLSVYLEELK